MKKMLTMLLAAIMALNLVACSSGGETKENADAQAPAAETEAEAPQEAEEATANGTGSYKIGLMLYSSSDEATITIMNGVKRAAEEAGVELVMGENGGDPTKTAALLQTMFSQDVDAIIDATWDASVGITTSQQCKEKGIPLVTCDVEYDDYAHLVGANNYGSGQVNGEYVANWIETNWDGEVEYVLAMYYYAGGEGVKARLDGCFDTLAEKGLMPAEENVIWQDNNGTTEKSKTITTDFLTAHPDASKIYIITNNDSGALGAYNAALTMGREADCMITSYNGDSFALEHLATVEESCWKGTVNFNLGGYGDLAIPALLNILETGEDNIDHELNTVSFVIDRDNVGEYYTK